MNYHVENGHRLPLDSKVYSRTLKVGNRRGGEDGYDGSGSVVVVGREACSRQIRGAGSSMLAPCGGCGQHVGDAHC